MKLVNLKNPVMASWMREQGARLDAPPFLSGAIETRKLLEQLSVKKDPLRQLTLGGEEGIFHAGRIKRHWVTDPKHGIPFLSSTDILQADLSHLALISKRAVTENPKLMIHKDWSLITRSGSIGRMAYTRPDMDGMACTEDVLRVVPDSGRILPGYLYAFLSSQFGLPLVIGGTYGAIIQHIEPYHIANLPVPRLGEELEASVHKLVQEAARQRSEARKLRHRVLTLVTEELDWHCQKDEARWAIAPSLLLAKRMDAFHHSRSIVAARRNLASHSTSTLLGSKVVEVFEPNRGSRKKVDDPAYGVPFLSSSEVFRLDPQGDYLISRHTPHFEKLLIGESDVFLPRSGQLGGIIGRSVLPLPGCYGYAASEHLVRVRCKTTEDALYVWAVLASEPGYLASIGTAFGSSIPSLDCVHLSELKVPWLGGAKRTTIKELAAEMIELLSLAVREDHHAVCIVESAIDEAS